MSWEDTEYTTKWKGKNFSLPKKKIEELPEELRNLAEKEGFSSFMYEEEITGKKNPTIGFGHLLTEEEKKTGLIHGSIPWREGISEEDAVKILETDRLNKIDLVEKEMRNEGINPDRFSPEQLKSIYEASFQLGAKGLVGDFKKRLKLAEEGDVKGAVKGIENTLWNEQTPKRVEDFKKGLQIQSPMESEGMKRKKWLNSPEKSLRQKREEITAGIQNNPPPELDFSNLKPEFIIDPTTRLASGNVSEEELRQIESANLREAEKQASQVEELSAVKPEVDQSAQNLKENVPQGMSEYKPSNPDPENLQSDLKDALMYFAPQALGLALGNAFGGTKAALAGAEQAGKMRDAYSDFKMKQLEVAQKLNVTKQDNQVVADFGDEQGRPIVFNKVTRRFFDVDGNTLDSSKIRNLKNERSQQYAGLQERSLNIREGQAGQLSEQQQTYLKGMLSSKGSLDRISNFMGKVNTGIVANSFQNLMEKTGFASKDYISMKQEVASLTNDYIKAVTGAQMSEPEAERISRALPSMDDPPEVFAIKVATLKNIIQGNEKAFDDSIRTGQPLKADTIAKIRKELDNYDSKVQSGGTAPASSIMSEAQRKRMEELRAKHRR